MPLELGIKNVCSHVMLLKLKDAERKTTARLTLTLCCALLSACGGEGDRPYAGGSSGKGDTMDDMPGVCHVGISEFLVGQTIYSEHAEEWLTCTWEKTLESKFCTDEDGFPHRLLTIWNKKRCTEGGWEEGVCGGVEGGPHYPNDEVGSFTCQENGYWEPTR